MSQLHVTPEAQSGWLVFTPVTVKSESIGFGNKPADETIRGTVTSNADGDSRMSVGQDVIIPTQAGIPFVYSGVKYVAVKLENVIATVPTEV